MGKDYLTGVAIGFGVAVVVHSYSCGSAQPIPRVTMDNPTELCAVALASAAQIQQQAAKLNQPALQFARQTCEAIVLGANVVQSNLNIAGASGGG
jgi:hypothetical protein